MSLKEFKIAIASNDGISVNINTALRQTDGELKLFVYEQRELAETMISSPIMKQFKAKIHNQGLFKAAQRELA